VQALQVLFDALPDDTGASFVVIVHLDPQAHSDLASILASRTRMPVVPRRCAAQGCRHCLAQIVLGI